jgi:hypothetical protein
VKAENITVAMMMMTKNTQASKIEKLQSENEALVLRKSAAEEVKAEPAKTREKMVKSKPPVPAAAVTPARAPVPEQNPPVSVSAANKGNAKTAGPSAFSPDPKPVISSPVQIEKSPYEDEFKQLLQSVKSVYHKAKPYSGVRSHNITHQTTTPTPTVHFFCLREMSQFYNTIDRK